MSKLGLGNIASLMKNAKKIQQMVQDAQTEFEQMEVSGEAGAGMVKVTMNGKHVALKVTIDPEAMQEDKAVLEELIAAAINNANQKIEKATRDKMSDASALMGMMEESEDDKS